MPSLHRRSPKPKDRRPMDVPIIEEPADSLVLSLASPGFTALYPRLRHAHRIPADRRAAMEPAWSRGRFPAHPVRFHRLRQVFVAEEGLVFNTAGELFRASRTHHQDTEIARAHAAVQQAVRSGLAAGSVPGPTVLTHKRGAANYGHWLIEMLPKAFLASRHLRQPDATYLVPDAAGRLRAVIAQSMAMAGIASARTHAVGHAPVYCDELILIDNLTSHGNFVSPLVLDCIDHIAAGIPPDPEAAALYVSRQSSGVRRFDNEAELTAILAARGVRIVDPGMMDFAAQVAAFRAARAVIGVMGAGMTNIVFAPAGIPVVDLAPAVMADTFFWCLANLRRQDYQEIRVEQRGPSKWVMDWDTDLHLPPAELEQVLDEILTPTPTPAPPAVPAAPPARPAGIVAIAIVKNEQDIIEPFVRHTLGLVDALVVIDTASADETYAILARLARALPGLVVTQDRSFAGRLPERMTRLMLAVQAAFLPDYVIALQADDFLRPDPGLRLADVLAAIPQGGFGLAPVQTFVLGMEDIATAPVDPPRSIRWQRAGGAPAEFRPVLRTEGIAAPALFFHHLPPGVRATAGPAPTPARLAGLTIQHFPVRSRAQIVGRTVCLWTDMLRRDPNPRDPAGLHWRAMFARVSANPDLSDAELCALSQSHAGVPASPVPGSPPAGYPRTCSTGEFPAAVTLIARDWESRVQRLPPVLGFARPNLADVPPVPGLSPPGPPARHWDELCAEVAPWRFLVDTGPPASVLDIGCGIGATLAALKRLGVADVYGLDTLPPQASVLDPWEYMACDPGKPLDLRRRYACVLSLDFAHTLPDAASQGVLLDTLTRHAQDRILFSAAIPGQPAWHGVSPRPVAWWLDRFAERGWAADLHATLALRCLSGFPAIRRNLLALVPGQDAAAARRLVDIAARPWAWGPRRAGVREWAFAGE